MSFVHFKQALTSLQKINHFSFPNKNITFDNMGKIRE